MPRTTDDASLQEIRLRYVDKPVSPHVLKQLQRDPRQGARHLYQSLKKRYDREREEKLRLQAMRHFELVLWRTGVRDVAGVDEAGVGPLAGPVVAAAVMFPPGTDISGVDDSKKLDPASRDALAIQIRAKASGIGVGMCTVAEIDEINIYHAGLLAMRRAVEGLPRRPQHLLVDARTVPGIDCPQNAFDKGDGINFTIAAAVMFPPDTEIAGINDSKQLDAPTRERLAVEIRAKASGVAVGIATVEEIDTINIYHASLLAMRRAVEGLPRKPQHVLVDARTVPGIDMPQNAFNKGDGLNFSIAAASIIAKTTRDAMLDAMDKEYPGYGFASHKGYPTPEHKAAIVKLGVLDVHRMSFPALHELQGEFSTKFYDLRTQLFAAESRDALGALEASFKSCASSLEDREAKKLKLLIARRWKVIA